VKANAKRVLSAID